MRLLGRDCGVGGAAGEDESMLLEQVSGLETEGLAGGRILLLVLIGSAWENIPSITVAEAVSFRAVTVWDKVVLS